MKTLARLIISAAFASLLLIAAPSTPAQTAPGLLSTDPLAQKNARPPQGQSQGSSLSEILAQLDQNALAQARIGLKEKGYSGLTSPGVPDDSTPRSTVIFAQGFKLAKVDACTLTLRNEDTQMIAHSKLIAASQEHFALEVYLPLQELSDRKGKAPYSHTKDLDKAKLLGTWRTEFTYRGFFSQRPIAIGFFAPGTRESKGSRSLHTVTFTFDDKEMADRFNSALRQAIRLCQRRYSPDNRIKSLLW